MFAVHARSAHLRMKSCLEMRTALSLGFGIVLASLAGCAENDGPVTYPVSGAVTYQGKPLVKGQIAFRPDTKRGGTGSMQAANIVEGKYSAKVTEGPKHVEIYGTWPIPGEFITAGDGSGKKFPKLQSLPAKYGERSTLTATIATEENSNVDFHLK